MAEIFSLTASKMTVLFFFMVLGYFFKKKNLTPDNTANVLSKLELYVFLPALCFSTFSENFTKKTVVEKSDILIWGIIILVITGVVSWAVSFLFSKDRDTRAVYTYALTIPNIAYLGYPLISAVLGEDILFDFMIFVIPAQIYIYTIALYILNPNHTFSPKSILTPPLIAMFLGGICGFFEIPLPYTVTNIFDSASACMAPLAMLLSGFILAKSPIKELIKNPKIYIACLLRLVIFPVVFTALLYALGADSHTLLLCACLLALPMGLNNIVFPEAFGGDSKTGAQSCFVCNVLGFISVPIAFSIIKLLIK